MTLETTNSRLSRATVRLASMEMGSFRYGTPPKRV
jgi:hypothetical protein